MNNLLKIAPYIYTTEEWMDKNKPSDDLIFKDKLYQQINNYKSLSDMLNIDVSVVGEHLSKSVKLPVFCFRYSPYNQIDSFIFVRDNFYDIKCCVISEAEIKIPMNIAHIERSQEWLNKEISRKANYDKISITDSRFQNDDWFSNEWSSGNIIRNDDRLYIGTSTRKCYFEGIRDLKITNEVFKNYKTNDKVFVLEVASLGKLAFIIDLIISSTDSGRYLKLAKERDRIQSITA